MQVDICPACLAELPVGYSGDHVAVDRVLSGDGRALWVAMTAGERREVVLTGLSRGASAADLARLLRWPLAGVRSLLPEDHPDFDPTEGVLEQQVRELWARGVPDTVIATRTGWQASRIGRIRQRLGLPAVTQSASTQRVSTEHYGSPRRGGLT